MAGIQVSGLVSGINWQNIISELVTADSAGMDQTQAQETSVNNQISALGSIGTDLTNLDGAALNLQDPTLFTGVTAGSTTSGSTWTVNADNGTATGNYQISVSKLATASQLAGASDIAGPLSSSGDLSSLTVANMSTAIPVTAGTFTVDGQPITITTSESLQDVFNAISSATTTAGTPVTASYDSTPSDPNYDKVTLSSASPITLGASNDTSNFLQALQLVANGGKTVTSTSTLGSLAEDNTIANSGLATPITAVDGSGNGSFVINGTTINYNINNDTLSTLLQRISNSGAGVTATYDSAAGQIKLVNDNTGATAINVSEASGGVLGALGLTGSGATMTQGLNAQFSVNGGPTRTSQSNALTAQDLGVTGLNVTVNSEDSQTIQVTTDTTAIQSSIQSFITAFNTLQSDISTDTVISTNATGGVSTSILSGILEVSDWGEQLQNSAFSAGSSLTGSVKSLDDLGIDFNGTTGQLVISDSAKLSQALSANTSDVQAFFQTGTTGFASQMGTSIIDVVNQNTAETSTLQAQSSDLASQVTTQQNQLNAEESQLETEFQAMETMMSSIQSQGQVLTSTYGGSSTTAASSSPNISVAGSNGTFTTLNGSTVSSGGTNTSS